MKNKINTYGYCVIKGKSNIPLHIVEIKHVMVHGFYVFSTANQANKFINDQISDLNRYEKITYNPDYIFSKNLIKAYKQTLNLFSKIENKCIYISYPSINYFVKEL